MTGDRDDEPDDPPLLRAVDVIGFFAVVGLVALGLLVLMGIQ